MVARAVIVVPAGPAAEDDARTCIAWCEDNRIPVVEVLIGEGYEAAVEVCVAGRAELIVILTREHLSPDRVPKLVVVEEERARAVERRRRRPGKSRRPDVIDR